MELNFSVEWSQYVQKVLKLLKYGIINGYQGYNYHQGLENIKIMCIIVILGDKWSWKGTKIYNIHSYLQL